MTTTPRLSIGLPVYNGEAYMAEALDALLGQSYGDFELIISDNASTDATEEICRDYQARDDRIRYLRQPTNVGCSPNHNLLVHAARGELFKWASDDDLYGRDLLLRCVEVLDRDPAVILSHSWTVMIDADGAVTSKAGYHLKTDSPDPVERFRSLLFEDGGDDDYGVIRTDVLRRTALNDSYWRADRTIVAELALHGRFRHVPEPLYLRRDHPDRAKRANPSIRTWCANQDPRRANRLRHPLPRLVAEYILGYVKAIRNAPLTSTQRRQCLGQLARWMADRANPGRPPTGEVPTEMLAEGTSIDTLVAGRRRESA
jgi:glycosyltransferase involved in cell wall biosynthesis